MENVHFLADQVITCVLKISTDEQQPNSDSDRNSSYQPTKLGLTQFAIFVCISI